jgi:nitrite reductase/ring-hydroxylating ferredoxin subunit
VIDVGALDEFPHGEPRIVTAGGREVAICRWGDEVFAVRNVCPHQSESFRAGVVRAGLTAASPNGAACADPSRPLLACPVHTWTYDLRTGACTVDPKLRVKTYPVEVRDGRVLVQTAREGARPATPEVEHA